MFIGLSYNGRYLIPNFFEVSNVAEAGRKETYVVKITKWGQIQNIPYPMETQESISYFNKQGSVQVMRSSRTLKASPSKRKIPKVPGSEPRKPVAEPRTIKPVPGLPQTALFVIGTILLLIASWFGFKIATRGR